MSNFWGRQCAFVFSIYVRKYRKYTRDRWIWCASAVISPLRQRLNFYAKTRLKMCHMFEHFIHMQYFLLLTNLVVVFVHWVSTGVLYEPQRCSLFWDCAAHPDHHNPPNTEIAQLSTTRDGEQRKTALWLWVHEMTWYLYTRGVRGRIKANQRWFQVTRGLCHEWFHHVHDGHCQGWRIRHSLLTSTLFHSLVPWWCPQRIRPHGRKLASVSWRTLQYYGHVANLHELLYQPGSKNGVM